jgi:hypothetical protein
MVFSRVHPNAKASFMEGSFLLLIKLINEVSGMNCLAIALTRLAASLANPCP